LGILSDRRRRVLECAFEFGASGLHTNQYGKSERRSRQVTTAQLVHHGSLREVEPPVHTWGFDQIPFGTTGASLSGLNAGEYSSPHLPCKRYNKGLHLSAEAQNRFLSQRQSSAPGGVLGLTAPNCRDAGSDQSHWFRPILWLTAWSETTEGGCYWVLEATKGSVDWVHQFRRPLLSNRERQSLRVPLRSRSQTLRHRRLARSHHHRFRYPGQSEPPVIDDPPPRRNLEEFRGAVTPVRKPC
jgi:hypothetical protein